MGIFRYRELTGAMMYLDSTTRVDIMWTVAYLSRFMANPAKEHWVAAKGLLRYLKGTYTVGIEYSGDCSLTSFVDSD